MTRIEKTLQGELVDLDALGMHEVYLDAQDRPFPSKWELNEKYHEEKILAKLTPEQRKQYLKLCST